MLKEFPAVGVDLKIILRLYSAVIIHTVVDNNDSPGFCYCTI